MVDDLKIIKKKYGEEMMHFCRDAFATILETPGVLSNLLLTYFEPSKELFFDLQIENLVYDFKSFIYRKLNNEEPLVINGNKTPRELLASVGYNLYECEDEEDIQKFKKYYAKGEELCTFNGGRLNKCHVFFAVKKDVDNIKREDFNNPKRQDLYGTSVISIQFDRNEAHTLSIKNRYNHTVKNPDATFSNNLDNIVEGLTDSFEKYYNLKQRHINSFEIPNYERDNQGKYYKYNYEADGNYYCPNNCVLVNHKAIKYPKERYILADYFLIDRQEKAIKCYDEENIDSFPQFFQDNPIKKIDLEIIDNIKIVKIETTKGIVTLELDKRNRIVGLTNPYIEEIGNLFLWLNECLSKIELPQVKVMGNDFLYQNLELKELNLPQAKIIGQGFLYDNNNLKKIELPKVEIIDNDFLINNESLSSIYMPQVKKIGHTFLYNNKSLTKIDLPKVEKIDSHFLYNNELLNEINMPNVLDIGECFMNHNTALTKIDLPKVEIIKDDFLHNNESLYGIYLPQVKIIGRDFLYYNNNLKKIDLPKVETIGSWFLYNNESLMEINLPSAKTIYDGFLYSNKILKRIDIPYVTKICKNFLPKDKRLQVINVLDENVYHQILKEHINLYTLKQALLKMKKNCSNTLKLQKKHG